MPKHLLFVTCYLILFTGCATIPKNNIDLTNPLHQEIQALLDKPFSINLYTKDAKIQATARYADENIRWGILKLYSIDEFNSIQYNMEKELQAVNLKSRPSKLINIEKKSDGVRAVKAVSYTGTFDGVYEDLTIYYIYDLIKSNSGWKIKYRKRMLKVNNLTSSIQYY